MRIHWMVRLYPHKWQERYGDEFMAVLEQHTPTIKTCLDIALNALDAHIDPTARGPRSSFRMDTFKRLRRSTGIIFVAFIAMLLSYVLFLSDMGDIFDWTIRHNPFTNFLNGILSNLGDLQLAALLVALLLVASALAFQKGATASKILRFLPLALVLFPTVMAGFYYGCRLFPGVVCHLDFGWGNYMQLSLLVIIPFVAIMLFKSTVSRTVIKVAWLAAACVVLGMLFQMALVLTWGVLAWSTSQQEVAHLAYGYNRSLMPGDYHIWLGAGLALVLLCGGAAIAALVQGMPAMWIKNKPAREAGAVEVE